MKKKINKHQEDSTKCNQLKNIKQDKNYNTFK